MINKHLRTNFCSKLQSQMNTSSTRDMIVCIEHPHNMVTGTSFSVIVTALIMNSLLLSVGFQFKQHHVLAPNSTNANTSSIDRLILR